MKHTARRAFIGASIGTMIEYYDFALFAIFLPIIAPIFFPASSAYASLVKGYVVLLIAMLMRPLGGLLFGMVGDAVGRKRALLLSMYGIALATLGNGLIPPHTLIGPWAATLVLLCKSVQMLCFGGEYNGAGIYVVEHAQTERQAFMGGLLTAATLSGALLATLNGVICTLPGMPDWSWRLAFILGGTVGLFGVWYRNKLHESPNFKRIDLGEYNFKRLIALYPRQLFAGFMLGAFATAPFNTVLLFINPILVANGLITKNDFMWLQTALVSVAVVVLIVSSYCADRFSPRQVMQVGTAGMAILAYPLLYHVQTDHWLLTIGAELSLIAVSEICVGPSNAYLKSLFAMQYRYRAASFSFTLGLSLVGGATPLIENYLYQLFNTLAAAAIWLVAIAILTWLALRGAQADYWHQ